MFEVKTGSLIEAEGEWKIDSRYGQQFEVLHWKEYISCTTVGVERFLQSGILKSIRNGKLPNLSNGLSTDFFFLERGDPEQIREVIMELVFKKLGTNYKVPVHYIQVLCPLRAGITGAINLNLAIRDTVNPKGKEIERGGIVFREQDRVMQIRNNYEKEIFNGEYGVIEAINYDEATVNFDGRVIRYKQHELDELTLAYAITIHKSKGCEIPIVVIVVSMEHQVALQRRKFDIKEGEPDPASGRNSCS